MAWPPSTPKTLITSGAAGATHKAAHDEIAAAVSAQVTEMDDRVGAPTSLNAGDTGEGGTVLDSAVNTSLADIVVALERSLTGALRNITSRLDVIENTLQGTPTDAPPPPPPPSNTPTTVSTPKIEDALALDGYGAAPTFSMDGAANSDVLVLLYTDSDGGTTNPLNIPTGWTQVGTTSTVGNIDSIICARWGDWGGSVTVGRGVDRWFGALFRLSGVNLTDVTSAVPVGGSAAPGDQMASLVIPSGNLLLAQATFDGTTGSNGSFPASSEIVAVVPAAADKRGVAGYRFNDTNADTASIGVAIDFTLDPTKTWVKAYGMSLVIPPGTPSGYPAPTNVVDPVTQSPSAVGGKWFSVNADNGKNTYGHGLDSTFSDLIVFRNSILPEMDGFFWFVHPGDSMYHWATDGLYGPKGAWNLFGSSQYAPLDMWNHAVTHLGATTLEAHIGGQGWTITELAAGSALPTAAASWFSTFAKQVNYWMNANSGKRVVMRMMGEFNGTWAANVGSPSGSGDYWIGSAGSKNATYIEAYRRIHAAVEAEMDVGNDLVWAWCPMAWAPGWSSGSVQDPAGAYPGDAYVDLLFPDWYTAPGTRSAQPLTSKGGSFAHLDACIDYMRTISAAKPVGIGEFGVGIPVPGWSAQYPSGWTAQGLWSDFFDVCIDKDVAALNLFYHEHYHGGSDGNVDWTLKNADAATLATFRSKAVTWLNA